MRTNLFPSLSLAALLFVPASLLTACNGLANSRRDTLDKSTYSFGNVTDNIDAVYAMIFFRNFWSFDDGRKSGSPKSRVLSPLKDIY